MGWWLALVILVVFPIVNDSMSGYGEGGIEVGLGGLRTPFQPDQFCGSVIQGWAAHVWWARVLECCRV